MKVAIVASVVGLACLLLGLWVGYQVGQSAEYERAWRESMAASSSAPLGGEESSVPPPGERQHRDMMGVEISWYRDQAAIACREQDSE